MPQPRTPRTLLAIPVPPALLGMARTGLPEPVLAASQGPATPASDTGGTVPLTPLQSVRIMRSAATLGGRPVLTFRVNTGGVTDPALEPAVLAPEFCPRTP
ncbi:hypothetical protein [Streptomyces sp. NPDC055085]